jgi:general secretion pathway protein H
MKKQRGESGFTLIEMVCVLAIVAMLAAIALPAFPHGTSRPRLEALATSMAALLKFDRSAAMRRGVPVATQISTIARTIRSGASGAEIRVPDDVSFSAVLADQCDQRDAGSTISFFASGLSCGGALSLSRLGASYEIRVAWLTGGVEIVPKKTF